LADFVEAENSEHLLGLFIGHLATDGVDLSGHEIEVGFEILSDFFVEGGIFHEGLKLSFNLEKDVEERIGFGDGVQNGISELMFFELFAMVDGKMSGEAFDLALDDVHEEDGLSTGVGAEESLSSVGL
jgi:hypothetical protein